MAKQVIRTLELKDFDKKYAKLLKEAGMISQKNSANGHSIADTLIENLLKESGMTACLREYQQVVRRYA